MAALFYVKTMNKYSVIICLSWLLPMSVCANPYIVMDLRAHNDAVPVKGATGGWQDPAQGSDTAFTHNWGEIGATYKGFGLGILKRYDFELEYTPDTAEFYSLVSNKKPLTTGKQYNLSLAARHMYSEGVRFSYQHKFSNRFEYSIGGSYLKGLWLTEGRLSGYATVVAENDYDFAVDVDYFYSEDALFDRKIDSPDGQGYSIDTLVDWNVWRELNVRLKIVDLIGRMYWKDAPNTTAVASSDVKEFDEDGYVKYNPVISGYETNRDFTQKLNPQIILHFAYPVAKSTELIVQIYSIKPGDYYQLGGSYAIDANNTVQILYMFDTNAVSIGYDSKFVQIHFTSDSFDFDKAHTLGLKLNAHIEFF